MKRIILMLAVLVAAISAQSSFDVLNLPASSTDAGLGLNHSPMLKPSRILTNPDELATLTVWNWVADIQGANVAIQLPQYYTQLQVVNYGELEYREDIPTSDPLSTFSYVVYNLGLATARPMGKLTLGLGLDLLMERSLNAKSSALGLNADLAYPMSSTSLVRVGLSHLGGGSKLDTESTELPSEMWLEYEYQNGPLAAGVELSSGDYIFSTGARYRLLERFEFMAGLQLETFENTLEIHPSSGITASWSNFNLGYSLYHLAHNLGPRNYITLYWSF